MARPREFEEREVLDRALDVFWAKGFDGTSVQDLVEATGLARASLYGAFGDKEKLYERVLEHYVAKVDEGLGTIDETRPAREQLEQVLSSWLGPRCTKVSARGCFLSLAGTEREDAPFAREAFAAASKKREKILTDVLRRGQARGEIDDERDPAALARVLVVLLQGIATVARAGQTPDRLRTVVDEAIALVARPAARRRK